MRVLLGQRFVIPDFSARGVIVRDLFGEGQVKYLFMNTSMRVPTCQVPCYIRTCSGF
jgi:hypothetical protein